jgi:small subunit ribosomal protein S9
MTEVEKEVKKIVPVLRGSASAKDGKAAPAVKKLKKYKGMYQAVGKRKCAVARVRLSDKGDKKGIIVNDMPMNEYFNSQMWQKTILAPLDLVGLVDKVYITVKVNGGGSMGQAEAIRHGISRILDGMDPANRKSLKALGFLTRDPRVKERKKPGLKRARRAPQWSKR